MMYGCVGVYFLLVNGVYDVLILMQCYQKWGYFWVQQGYFVIFVDGFGLWGYLCGFVVGIYDECLENFNEVMVCLFDVYGVLVYLCMWCDVMLSWIVLQGWLNGGSVVLVMMVLVMFVQVLLIFVIGFCGVLSLYLGCGLNGFFDEGLVFYVLVWFFVGSFDEEIDLKKCQVFV